jgi:sensor domain CHASE-containing protein
MPIVVEVSSWNLPLLLLVIVVVVVAAILIWLFYKGAAGQTLKERK